VARYHLQSAREQSVIAKDVEGAQQAVAHLTSEIGDLRIRHQAQDGSRVYGLHDRAGAVLVEDDIARQQKAHFEVDGERAMGERRVAGT
jgi:hypothetical protein